MGTSSVRWWWFAAAGAAAGGGDDGDTGSPIAMKLVRRRLWVVFGRARPPLVPATAPALPPPPAAVVGDSSRELVVDNDDAAAAAAAIWLVERNDDDDDALPPPLLIAVAPPDSVYMLCSMHSVCRDKPPAVYYGTDRTHTHTGRAHSQYTRHVERERDSIQHVSNPKCVCVRARAGNVAVPKTLACLNNPS
jgi:hypothetical protein